MARISDSGGVALHPRRVNKTPPRKTVPIQGVGIRGVARRPTPNPNIFGPISSASPTRQWVTTARHRTNRAQRRAEKNVVLPRLPAHIPASQRGYASGLIAAAAHRQGIHTGQEVHNLPAAQRKIIQRAAHGFNARQDHVYAQIAVQALSDAEKRLGNHPSWLAANGHAWRKASYAQLVAFGRQHAKAHAVKAKMGPAEQKVQLAGFLPPINLSAIGRGIMSATSLNSGDLGPRQFVNNALGDVKTLGETPIMGAYTLGSGAVNLIGHGDPSTFVNLGKGIAQGIGQEVRHPDKYFLKHPILAGLDVAGATSVLGHAAGGLSRAGAFGRAAKMATGRVRPPVGFVDNAAVADSGLYRERSYSGDIFRQSVQKHRDSKREPILDEHGKPVTVIDRGQRVRVLKPGTIVEDRRLQQARANFISARATDVERMVRDQAAKDRKIKLRGRDARRLAAMVTEGQVTTGKWLERDLRAQRARLETEYRTRMANGGFRHTGEARANRENVAFIDRALGSPKVLARAEQIATEGIRHGKALTAHDLTLDAHGLLPERAGTAARLKHVAVYHMDARWDPDLERLVAGPRTHEVVPGYTAGEVLPYQEVEKFLTDRGRDPKTVAYLPAKSPGARAWHGQMRPGSRPNLLQATRTGEQARKGAVKTTAKLVREQGVRQQTMLNKAQQVDKFIAEHGLSHPALGKSRKGQELTATERQIVQKGGDFTGPEAKELIDRLAHDKNEEWTAVTAYPGRLSAATKKMLREQHGTTPIEGVGQGLLNDRIVAPEELGKHLVRNVRLVPQALMDQQLAHLAPAGPLVKAFQLLNRPFRMAVLPQPRWLAGNFIEPHFVRLPASGSGVVNIPGMGLDLAAARKGVKALAESDNPAFRLAAKEIQANQFGGLLIGGRGASVHRSRDNFKTYGHVVKSLPVVDQIAELGSMATKVLTWPADQYFRVNRAFIEGPTQRVAFGRQLRRDVQDMQGSFLESVKLSKQAVADAAKGLVNTPAQERFMRSQQELLGKYQGYGPFMRQLMQGPAPFLPWALSAARFVYWTMPAHRSAVTALLVQSQKVVQPQWDAAHSDLSPQQQSLKAAARTKSGGLVDFSRYTPYGLSVPISEGNFQGVTGQMLPQLQGTIAAIQGQDPFGQPLRGRKTASNPSGKVNPLAAAGYGFLESMVPYLAMARRLREHGETSLGDSTLWNPSTKAGTSHGMSAIDRTLNPLRPVYLRAGASGSKPRNAVERAQQRAQEHLSSQAAGGVSPAVAAAQKRAQQLLERGGR